MPLAMVAGLAFLVPKVPADYLYDQVPIENDLWLYHECDRLALNLLVALTLLDEPLSATNVL